MPLTSFDVRMILCAAAFTLLVGATADAEDLSNAAKYLIDQEIAEACEGRKGTFAANGIFETDLTGDGRADLLLAHQAITCDGRPSMSLFCGMQVCSVKIYHREGQLLQLKREFLGQIVGHTPGPPPTFDVMAHGGATQTWRPWSD